MEGGVPRGGRKLAVLRQHHGATLQSAAEATVDLLCIIVCFNKLFGDVNIFSIVLSKKDNFLSVFYVLLNSLRMVLPVLF